MMFGGSPERMGRMIDHMLDGLNASDAQRAPDQADRRRRRRRPEGAARGRPRAAPARRCRCSPRRRSTPTPPSRCASRCCSSTTRSSRRMTQAMLDVGRVLTPEQRAPTRRAHAATARRAWKSGMKQHGADAAAVDKPPRRSPNARRAPPGARPFARRRHRHDATPAPDRRRRPPRRDGRRLPAPRRLRGRDRRLARRRPRAARGAAATTRWCST